MPHVWFLVVCSIWGSSFILMKRAADCLSPAAISAGRVGFGALVLGAVLWRMSKPIVLRPRDGWPLLGVILTGFVWPYTVQPWLIAKHQNSAFIGMTVAFAPLLILAVSSVVLRTRPTPRQAFGVVGALCCLMLLMWDGWQQSLPTIDLALAISVPLSYAFASVWIRKYLSHVPVIEMTFACLAGSSILLLPLAGMLPGPAMSPDDSLIVAWTSLAILGVAGTGLATCLFNRLIVQQGPLFAAMVTNLVPLGAMAWGWLDAETITPRQLLAITGVLTMVGIVQFGSPRTTPTPVSAEPAQDLVPQVVEA